MWAVSMPSKGGRPAPIRRGFCTVVAVIVRTIERVRSDARAEMQPLGFNVISSPEGLDGT
jgi:hypothetical protein